MRPRARTIEHAAALASRFELSEPDDLRDATAQRQVVDAVIQARQHSGNVVSASA